MQYGNHHLNINSVIKALQGVNIFNSKCREEMVSVEFSIILE